MKKLLLFVLIALGVGQIGAATIYQLCMQSRCAGLQGAAYNHCKIACAIEQ